jgi:hypothetical protein
LLAAVPADKVAGVLAALGDAVVVGQVVAGDARVRVV